MPELNEQIKRLAAKTQLLLQKHRQVLQENEQLRKKLDRKQQAEGEFTTTIAELEQKLQLLKAAAGNLGKNDKLALEKNINKHLKEIERCITFLSE